MSPPVLNYWKWFVCGSGGRPGYRRLINVWLVVHAAVGIILAGLVPIDLTECARTVLLPLAGVFVGLSFAWAGNALALMQTTEIDAMTRYHEGGYSEYVWTFQTAILALLVTLTLWGIAGLRVFDETWPTPHSPSFYVTIKCTLFLLSSISLRECWHVVLGSQWLLLTRRTIRENKDKNKNPSN